LVPKLVKNAPVRSTLSLFAERLVHRDYLGLHISASWYQFINSFCVVLLASGFAVLWLNAPGAVSGQHETRVPARSTALEPGFLRVAPG